MNDNKLIFKALVGSQAYGTSIPTSDKDYKGIYTQSLDDLLSFKYKEQYEVGKDECYYEVKRFLELLSTANPTVLELLYTPEDCVIQTSPEFELISKHRDKFLTKKCLHSFGGYAVAQIKKARGLNKKMNWEKEEMTRKTPLDFCYVITLLGSVPLKEWLLRQKGRTCYQEYYGASNINNARDLYYIYPDASPNKILGYHGLINIQETSNDLRLSSIPKDQILNGIVMSYNKDGYIKHCKDYLDYTTWLNNRNTQRYIDVVNHNQKIDGKNLMHCRRLLDTAIEIANEGTINVRRPNADYLLKIRRGEIPLDKIIEEAEQDLKGLDWIYETSDLPNDVDREFVNDLLLEIRDYEKNQF